MQKDIYNILPKHFAEETTSEEEALVAKFKEKNAFEYRQLRKLWTSKQQIQVHDFDTSTALEKVKKKMTPVAKVVPMYRRLTQVAAAAAILIVGSFLAYQYFSPMENNLEMLVEKTVDEGKVITLSDGSKVWLNRNAVLRYPEKFGTKKRTVKLDGEAFFDIKRDESKPFIIETDNAFTEVLGTSFNILASENQTNVTVVTGKVEVSNRTAEKVVLVAGEVGQVEGKNVERLSNFNPNTTAWKTGEFTFENTPVLQALKDLNTYYFNQFSVENTESNCELNVNFKQAKIQDIIETIELMCGTKFSKKENQFNLE